MENQKQNILIIKHLSQGYTKHINLYLTTEEGQKVDYIFIDHIDLVNYYEVNTKGLEVPVFCKKIFINDTLTEQDNIEIFKNIYKIPFGCKILSLDDLYYNEILKNYKNRRYNKELREQTIIFKIINFNCLIDDFDIDNYNIIQIKETKIKKNNKWSFIPKYDKVYYKPIDFIDNEYYYKLPK